MTLQAQSLAVARAAVAAARDVAGVLDVHGGRIGEFATYGGGERVVGVRVRTGTEPSVALKLVVEFGRQLPELTDEVRHRVDEAVAPLLGRDHVPVDLDIVDVRAAQAAGALPVATSPAAPATSEEVAWQS
jgi:uncharacterized alkaline shock family protein YloU